MSEKTLSQAGLSEVRLLAGADDGTAEIDLATGNVQVQRHTFSAEPDHTDREISQISTVAPFDSGEPTSGAADQPSVISDSPPRKAESDHTNSLPRSSERDSGAPDAQSHAGGEPTSLSASGSTQPNREGQKRLPGFGPEVPSTQPVNVRARKPARSFTAYYSGTVGDVTRQTCLVRVNGQPRRFHHTAEMHDTILVAFCHGWAIDLQVEEPSGRLLDAKIADVMAPPAPGNHCWRCDPDRGN